MDPLIVLVNAQAGLKHPVRPDELAVARALTAESVPSVIEEVEPARLAERIRELSGQRLLGVAGGDGTQRTAARTLAGSDTTLVPFPTGRLNHFARRLGIGTVEAAARAVRGGKTRAIPVGIANDRVFVNTAVVGAYPGMVQVRERLRPALTHWPASAAAGVWGLLRWEVLDLHVRTPDDALRIPTTMLWVGIGAGSFPEPHRAPVAGSGGALEMVTLPGRSRVAAFRLMAAALRNRLRDGGGNGHGLPTRRVEWVELDADGPLPVALDGEPRQVQPPLRIRFCADALRVVAPAAA
jgi:diacylglycerol kinase family enzyme